MSSKRKVKLEEEVKESRKSVRVDEEELTFHERDEWREWLQKHHMTASSKCWCGARPCAAAAFKRRCTPAIRF